MSAAENKKLVREAFAAWANGDGMAFFNLLADNASWTVMGTCPISGTYVGREQLIEDALKPQRAKLAGPPTPTVLNLIAEGDTVVIQWIGKSTTKTKPASRITTVTAMSCKSKTAASFVGQPISILS